VSSTITAATKGEFTTVTKEPVGQSALQFKRQINTLIEHLQATDKQENKSFADFREYFSSLKITNEPIFVVEEYSTQNYINSMPGDIRQYILTVRFLLLFSPLTASFCLYVTF
jgi:hypothetical protein